MSTEEKTVIKKSLEDHRGWRVAKIFIIIGLVAAAVIGIISILQGYKDCQWDHFQYISRNDVVRSFWAAPPVDCNLDTWWQNALVGSIFWLLILIVAYIVIKRVAAYVAFGKKTKRI